ncbi:MAG: Phospho-2-dehydro-3-deoxyheptonate aldolase [Alphaproteobacteria bacterium MarineAlpha9_Bin4]|nr:3-deoxy-7-phosphoheptulonate synthase class II [Pelagibacterales bacterium]PPR26075.1 MAG: Phospho-2-dehydro-3-deoxyheptonate aldolase [Alphaproteobacteria bacterium MarineAlpha9_Bin4]
MENIWKKNSWRNYPISQQPIYDDKNLVKKIEEEIEKLPPLVFADEVRKLKKKLANVAAGKAFLLQGGDCAESFSDFSANNLRDSFKVLLQMSAILTYASSLPVVKVGRMAGQFAKPRSENLELKDGVKLPSYRGDIINDIVFDEGGRKPDPRRMLKAYSQSAFTLNLLRAFATGGLADLEKVHKWNLDFVKQSTKSRFLEIANGISKALDFMKACGLDNKNNSKFGQVDFFTSHEALLLNYEECLTRTDSFMGGWFDCSAHMLWIGERTRKLDEAHVEFMRGIENPIGVKIGPKTENQYLIDLINKLNPKNEPGRITLITRMGAQNLSENLPRLIEEINKNKKIVIWSCDPMHANTYKSNNGYKTRSFDKIAEEIEVFFSIHKKQGTFPGGIHLEITGQNVTECVGGEQKIREENLSDRYHTHCDPRLNANQGVELAFKISEFLKTN